MVEYRFTLELTDYSVQRRITLNQGEANARKLIVSFSMNGKTYKLKPNNVVAFRSKTPSGAKIFNYCDVVNNSAEYVFTPNNVAESGISEAYIEIYDSDSVLFSPRIEYLVVPKMYGDKIIEEENEFTLLQTELNRLAAYYEQLGDLDSLVAQADKANANAAASAASSEKSAKEANSFASVASAAGKAAGTYASDAGIRSEAAGLSALAAAKSEENAQKISEDINAVAVDVNASANNAAQSAVWADESYTKAQANANRVLGYKEQIEKSFFYQKEIYKTILQLLSLGGDDVDRIYGIEPTSHDVMLKENTVYTFSIPHTLVGSGTMRLTDYALTLEYTDGKYSGRYTPTKNKQLTTTSLVVQGVTEFDSSIELVVEEQTPLTNMFGDIDNALQGIIDLQEEIIGGDTV